MSPIKLISSIRGLLLLLAIVSLSACGDDNSNSKFSQNTGKHPDNWIVSGHKDTVIASGVEPCYACHGENGVGGISNVSCNDCHLGGPLSLHPVAWGSGPVNVTNNHGAYLYSNTGSSCKNVYCHGVNWEGATGPACVACHN